MTAVPDGERRRRERHRGHFASHGNRVAGAGDQVIHRDRHLDRLPDDRQRRAQEIAELPEHPQRLPLLLDLGFAQRVAQIDGFGRLHEERLRTRRLAVHDPGRPGPRIPPDRNDVAPFPYGHGATGGHRAGF